MEEDRRQETDATDILTLVDDDGAEHEFEVVDSAEFEGDTYMALVPIFEEGQDLLDDSGELVILKVVNGEEEEYLEAIEDDEEFERVGAFFTARLSDVFDFED